MTVHEKPPNQKAGLNSMSSNRTGHEVFPSQQRNRSVIVQTDLARNGSSSLRRRLIQRTIGEYPNKKRRKYPSTREMRALFPRSVTRSQVRAPLRNPTSSKWNWWSRSRTGSWSCNRDDAFHLRLQSAIRAYCLNYPRTRSWV